MQPRGTVDLISLELYLATVRLGSLSRAARQFMMSQPSASARIRQLERDVELTLLQRSPSGSIPTEAGEGFSEAAAAVLQAVEGLYSRSAQLRQENRLRIAASYTIGEFFLPSRLADLSQRTLAHIEVDIANSTQVVQKLRDNTVDLGFVEGPDEYSDLRSCVVGADSLVVIVPPAHRWAGRAAGVRADELVGERLVLRERGSGTREAFDQALSQSGVQRPAAVLELSSTAAIKAAVAANAGVSAISELAIIPEIERGSLVVVPVEGLTLTRQYRALWTRLARPSKSARELVSALAAASRTYEHERTEVAARHG